MKRLSEYNHFVYSLHETQDKCILRGVLWHKPVTPPPVPLKYPTDGSVTGVPKKYKTLLILQTLKN